MEAEIIYVSNKEILIQIVCSGKTPNSLISLNFYIQFNILINFAPPYIPSINYFRSGWFY